MVSFPRLFNHQLKNGVPICDTITSHLIFHRSGRVECMLSNMEMFAQSHFGLPTMFMKTHGSRHLMFIFLCRWTTCLSTRHIVFGMVHLTLMMRYRLL